MGRDRGIEEEGGKVHVGNTCSTWEVALNLKGFYTLLAIGRV